MGGGGDRKPMWEQGPYITYSQYSIVRYRRHKKGTFGPEGVTGYKLKDRERDDMGEQGRKKRGFQIAEHGGIAARKLTYVRWSRNASSGGCTHPPV